VEHIRCPICFLSGPPLVQIDHLAICASCGASLHLGSDGIRAAKFDDTRHLTVEALRQLQEARASKRARRAR
jgi:hypothetical protein